MLARARARQAVERHERHAAKAMMVRSPLLPSEFSPLLPSASNQVLSFYLNLESRSDRRSQMEAMLSARRLRAQRVPAATVRDAEVLCMARAHPGKATGYLANLASHTSVWERVAAQEDTSLALIFEDDVLLHRDWWALLHASLCAIAKKGTGVGSDSGDTGIVRSDMGSSAFDCLLLDGLYITGETSAERGWLGPDTEGVHAADGVAFSSAYALTPAAARWLLDRRAARPGSSTEAYLMQLQEERRATWTCLPRLALQRWDEAVSSVSGSAGCGSMRGWYEKNYFPRWPWALYAEGL